MAPRVIKNRTKLIALYLGFPGHYNVVGEIEFVVETA